MRWRSTENAILISKVKMICCNWSATKSRRARARAPEARNFRRAHCILSGRNKGRLQCFRCARRRTNGTTERIFRLCVRQSVCLCWWNRSNPFTAPGARPRISFLFIAQRVSLASHHPSHRRIITGGYQENWADTNSKRTEIFEQGESGLQKDWIFVSATFPPAQFWWNSRCVN